MMNDDVRERIVPLKEVLSCMNLSVKDVVVDVGAGNGYYAMAFAKLVSKVYALDASYGEEELKQLKGQAQAEGINNLEFVARDACQGLGVDHFTHAFFSNSFHDMRCRESLIEEISHQTAKVTFVEFKPWTPFGPPPFRRISKEKLVELLSKYGYSPSCQKDFSYHYAVTFIPRDRGAATGKP